MTAKEIKAKAKDDKLKIRLKYMAVIMPVFLIGYALTRSTAFTGFCLLAMAPMHKQCSDIDKIAKEEIAKLEEQA